jgi:alpha-tubulin suppressor-like RCC1 family protein
MATSSAGSRRLVRHLSIGLVVLAVIASVSINAPAATNGVLSWGVNTAGKLGRSTSDIFSARAGAVRPLANITQVSAGGQHALALRSDGTVWAWGSNASGQLGNGTRTSSRKPVQVRTSGGPLKQVKEVSAGLSHSVALTKDGFVLAWGENAHGQLGVNDRTDRLVATGIRLSRVIQISAGKVHTLAVIASERAYSWGSNGHGELGRSTASVPQDRPGRVGSFRSVAAGGAHSLAIEAKTDVIWAWGSDSRGQLGDGSPGGGAASPRKIGAPNVTYTGRRIAAGGGHSLAVLKSVISEGEEFSFINSGVDGFLFAWGANDHGQLGDGSTEDRPQPVSVRFDHKPTRITAGDAHSQALIPGGSIYSWGYNRFGAVGDGTTADRSTPVTVRGVPIAFDVDAASGFSLAVADVAEVTERPRRTPRPTARPLRRVPKLRVDPSIGPPGFVTTAYGKGFPDNRTIVLVWNRGIGRTTVVTGPNNGSPAGAFTVPVLVYPRDQLGDRVLRASGFGVQDDFLVVPPQMHPRRFVSRG